MGLVPLDEATLEKKPKTTKEAPSVVRAGRQRERVAAANFSEYSDSSFLFDFRCAAINFFCSVRGPLEPSGPHRTFKLQSSHRSPDPNCSADSRKSPGRTGR